MIGNWQIAKFSLSDVGLRWTENDKGGKLKQKIVEKYSVRESSPMGGAGSSVCGIESVKAVRWVERGLTFVV